LNDDNLNLTSGAKLTGDPTKRFQTHNHVATDPGYNNQTAHSVQSSGGIQKHQPQSGFSNAARNNLQIHRITSQQDHKAQQQHLNDALLNTDSKE